MSGGEVEQELADFLFLLGRAGHLGDLVEDTEHQRRLEIFDCHVINDVLGG